CVSCYLTSEKRPPNGARRVGTHVACAGSAAKIRRRVAATPALRNRVRLAARRLAHNGNAGPIGQVYPQAVKLRNMRILGKGIRRIASWHVYISDVCGAADVQMVFAWKNIA